MLQATTIVESIDLMMVIVVPICIAALLCLPAFWRGADALIDWVEAVALERER